MCVIAAKPAGIEMPTEEEIETMWFKNNDGAGLMYAINNKVHIEKGFMKLEDFKEKLTELDKKYELKKLPLVMHFRITTHGGTSAENTHPFPISDSIGMLKKPKVITTLGVAHNGIINVTPRKGISDTMEYIAGQLAPLARAVPDFYKNKDLLQMIANATTSKLAFLDGKGKIVTVGEFYEHNGVKYSNRSYESYYNWRNFDWDEWDYENWKNHCGERIVVRKLMWLSEDRGEYVINTFSGKVVNGEFAIDAAGCLYEYDYNEDCFEEVCGYNYQAKNENGMPLKYNPKSEMISEELVLQ